MRLRQIDNTGYGIGGLELNIENLVSCKIKIGINLWTYGSTYRLL